MDVDGLDGLQRHSPHGRRCRGQRPDICCCQAILGDCINSGDQDGRGRAPADSPSCPAASLAHPDETSSAALAELGQPPVTVIPFAAHWGDGTTFLPMASASGGAGRGESTGHVNRSTAASRGGCCYNPYSRPVRTVSHRVVNVRRLRDSTCARRLCCTTMSDLRIEEHTPDTAGFTDHVFRLDGTCWAFRFRTAHFRDSAKPACMFPNRRPGLTRHCAPMVGGTMNTSMSAPTGRHPAAWPARSKQGTVTASLMSRKLGSYPRQNGLPFGLANLGRIEAHMFSSSTGCNSVRAYGRACMPD